MTHDRRQSGDVLATAIAESRGNENYVVAGIPRGGAIVAARAAMKLGLRYECVPVCRVGMPCFPDVTLGAVDPDGDVMFDPKSQLTRHELGKVGGAMATRLQQQVDSCRGDREPLDFEGLDVIVIDDAATNDIVPLTALRYLRRHGARRVTFAVPVAAAEVTDRLSEAFDGTVFVDTVPAAKMSGWYGTTEPTEDEVHECLVQAWSATPAP